MNDLEQTAIERLKAASAMDDLSEKTVDAVPVVRCRECKHYTHKEQGYFCTAFVGYDFNVRFENDFCSYGERK